MLTPTTNAGDALGVYDYESGLETNLSTNGYWEIDNDRTVMTNQGGRMDVQDSFPNTPSEGDICIRTDEDLAYYYDGSSWNPFSYGDDGNGNGNGDDPDPPEPNTIDDFEWSGDVSDRYDTGGRADPILTSNAALGEDSTQGLHVDGGQITISHPTDGTLDGYIRSGEEFQVLLQPNIGGGPQYWLLVCFDADSEGTGSLADVNNYYSVENITDSTFRIRKAGTTLDSASVSYSTGSTYRMRCTFDTTAGITITLESESGAELAELTSNDTEYIDAENGIGYRQSNSGGSYWDEIVETGP